MNLYRRILKITTASVVIFLLASCDEDFSTVGGGIIEDPAGVQLREYDVNAYSVNLKSVQTNNTSPKLLGVYNDQVFGQKSASVLAQLNMGRVSPQFPQDSIVLDSVILNLPYFSTQGVADDNGNPTYSLDSIYGSGSFKLSIYESKYFLRFEDASQGFDRRQAYYSDQQSTFEQFLNTQNMLYQNENLTPSPARISSREPNATGSLDTVSLGPALRVHLNTSFFQEKILNMQGSSELSSQSNFDDYFRGVFFKAEPNSQNSGSMALLDFNNANATITMYYSYTGVATIDGESQDTRLNGSFNMNFSTVAGNGSAPGNIVNTFEGSYPGSLLNDVESTNPEDGSQNLYLEGGQGMIGVVELFKNGELDDLRTENILINEANLEFYLNNDIMGSANAPGRLYIYNLDDNTVIADYSLEQNAANPALSKTIFSAPPQTDEDGLTKYTLRLTSHVNNLIRNNTDNVKLGISVTSNINQSGNTILRESTPEVDVRRTPSGVPSASLITPRGGVFYGSKAVNEARKLKLNLYYTGTAQE